jgi:hypothetical protein
MKHSKSKTYRTVLTFAATLLVVYFLKNNIYALYLSVIITFLVLINHNIFKYPIDLLEYISPYLSKILYLPLLVLSFYLIILPISLIRKLIKKETINNNQFQKNTNSNFTEQNILYTSDDLDHPF